MMSMSLAQKFAALISVLFFMIALFNSNVIDTLVGSKKTQPKKAANNPAPSTKHAPANIPEAPIATPKKDAANTVVQKNRMLTSSDLLPSDDASTWAKVHPDADKQYGGQKFITGINTQGSSMKNANLQLRADPVIPQKQVSPWMQSSIDPDMTRKQLC